VGEFLVGTFGVDLAAPIESIKSTVRERYDDVLGSVKSDDARMAAKLALAE
jgi:hypothetical protein